MAMTTRRSNSSGCSFVTDIDQPVAPVDAFVVVVAVIAGCWRQIGRAKGWSGGFRRRRLRSGHVPRW